MKRRALQDLLVRAERDVSRGEQVLARHRLSISKRELEGHDCPRSRKLLDLFTEIQKMHLRRRDALRRQLGASSPTTH